MKVGRSTVLRCGRKHVWWLRYRAGVALTDAVAVLGASTVAGPVSLAAAIGLGALWWVALGVGGARDARLLGVGDEEYRRIVTTTAALTGMGAALAVLAGTVEPMRAVLLGALPVGLGALVLSRWLWRQYVHARRRRSADWSHRVLVTGSAEAAARLAAELRRRRDAGFLVVDTAAVEPGGDPAEQARAVMRTARRVDAHVIAVAAGEGLGEGALRRLGWLLEGSGLQLVVAPGLTAVAGPRVRVRPIAGLPLLSIEEPVFSGAARIAKRLFDTAAALAGIVVAAPLMLLVAAAVALDDRGPVLFRQTRVGKHGKPFTMVKFRTMVVDAERARQALMGANESDGPLFKIRADPRLTRVGRVLRRYSLDELPQLVNVLFGRMSLVGPRPPLPEEVLRYAKDTRRRLLVPPGLTGLWQISGRSNLSWPEGIALDLHYVDNWSFTTDLVILWKTARAVVGGTGAY
ncbi:sugar transferase [Actinokineospora guangxiensis]|uniref:Sugar transferase n=1 Tax=Actinokineospora guangxiensis TaxID=1490288 RepID=A0ABW0EJW8_9PSEU